MVHGEKGVGDCPYGWPRCQLGAGHHSQTSVRCHRRWAADPSAYAKKLASDRARQREPGHRAYRRKYEFQRKNGVPLEHVVARAGKDAAGRVHPNVFCRDTVVRALSRTWGINAVTLDGYLVHSEAPSAGLKRRTWTCDYSFLPNPDVVSRRLNFRDHRVWSAPAVKLSARFAPGKIFSGVNLETANWPAQRWDSLLSETARSNPSPLQAAINDGAGIVTSWRLLQRVVGSMTQKASKEGAAHA